VAILIVIGGGATGLGIALDAVTRGYKTLLLEQSDFSAGTSSRSTKLVHGGVRYLAQGDLLLVIEALEERGHILKNAPHLSANQEFIIPVYNWWDVVMYTVGLKFYDLLAGPLSLGKSYFIGREKTLKKLPLLQQESLLGGVVYHDGQFDDARLAVSLAHNTVDRGGIVLNYFKVIDLLKDDKGRINGVSTVDLESRQEYQLKSRLIINATGIFADDIHRMDDKLSKPTIRPSQGVHLVLDKSFLRSDSAIMIPKTDDGRVLFAIPWYGKVVVGTTDTPLDTITMEPVPLRDEINFILETAGKYLVKPPCREDVLSIFAGLRPLAATGKTSSTKEVSRRHKITLSASGLLTVIGGKWTTYRCMAEEVLNKAISSGMLEKRKCVTKNLNLYNGSLSECNDRLGIYGKGAVEIRKIINDDSDYGRLVNPSLPYTVAEMIWICRNEMPQTLSDILARRTRALFLDVNASVQMAPWVCQLLAKETGRDEKWQKDQLETYNRLVINYL
jgi:glycerol-3-phosphate dehydrogenase